METPYIIAIAGGSCSGKTTLAQAIQTRLGPTHCIGISSDDYYHDLPAHHRANHTLPDFDVPDALDFDLLCAELTQLACGETIHPPTYDFPTHRRVKESGPIHPCPLVIVEGVLILTHTDLRRTFNTSLFITCPSDERLRRRLHRDTTERGRTAESVQDVFANQVEPAQIKYVDPSAAHAEHIFDQDIFNSGLDAAVDKILSLLPARLTAQNSA